jgi:hypothetical protein
MRNARFTVDQCVEWAHRGIQENLHFIVKNAAGKPLDAPEWGDRVVGRRASQPILLHRPLSGFRSAAGPGPSPH